MITKKEDLINTYVKNTLELRREFLSLAVKFGLIGSKFEVCESSEGAVVAYWKDVAGDNPRVGCWFAYADQIKAECRELTLSDLKPRTRTEYERVTESIWELRDEFERGELYCKHEHAREYTQITNTQTLAQALHGGFCYRLAEKEIDERQEFVDKAYHLAQSTGSYDVDEITGAMYDAGCRFQD